MMAKRPVAPNAVVAMEPSSPSPLSVNMKKMDKPRSEAVLTSSPCLSA